MADRQFRLEKMGESPCVLGWASALFDKVVALGYAQSYAAFVRKIRNRGLRPSCGGCAGTKGRPTAIIDHPLEFHRFSGHVFCDGANDALRKYVQDRLGGLIAHPEGQVVPGPQVKWTGRRHGPSQTISARIWLAKRHPSV